MKAENKNAIFSLLLIISTLLLNSQTTTAQCHIDDWTALKALYESTDGDNWINNTGWQEVTGNAPASNCNLENLFGVGLDAQGRVNYLSLYDNQLSGSIPPELGNLSNLVDLRLDSNQLIGSIPPELGNLSNLQSLLLFDNLLSGSIPPELGNLSNLQGLSLPYNELSGSIPPELGNLSNLEILLLYNNQLSSNIPSELGNLTNLYSLYLNNNQLGGSIPPELGNLTNLTELYLNDNILGGSVPSELGNLTNLTELHLNNNQLSGCYAVNLLNLSAGDNTTISDGNSFDASWEAFRYNLDGSGACNIPDYGTCHQNDLIILLTLNVSTNGFNWTNTWDLNQPLYTWHGVTLNGFGCVTTLNLNSNNLNGSIPPELGNLSNLQELHLYSNQLIGSIPPELGNLSNLDWLSLSSNELSGNIPPELGNLSHLTFISLSSNELSGSIPPELGNLSNLKWLYLSSNELNGSIPPELGNLSNLYLLELDSNQLSGSIPPELGNLSNLGLLEINDNDLSGCYIDNLAILCTQLISVGFDGDSDISVGNNFEAGWEDFCATGAGTCVMNSSDVWPGDLNHDGIVNNQDISLSGLFRSATDLARATEHQNIVWYAHPSEDWGVFNKQGIDLKHHDCNGDGVIDETDTLAVRNNMGSTWKAPDPPPPPPAESDYQVMLNPIDQIFDGYLVMNVALERRTGGDLTILSGHFTIDYSDVEGTFSFVELDFLPITWLGVPSQNLWFETTHFPDDKKIEVGFTKNNDTNSTGSGNIAQLILLYSSSAKQAGTSDITYQFTVNTIGVHNNNGDFTPIEDQLLRVNLNSQCEPNWIIDEGTPFQNEYKSSNNITTNGFVLIGEDQEVEYKANRITLNSGFSIKIGKDSHFRASYGNCTSTLNCDPLFTDYPALNNYINPGTCTTEVVEEFYDGSFYYYLYLKQGSQGEVYLSNNGNLIFYGSDDGDTGLAQNYGNATGRIWQCGC